MGLHYTLNCLTRASSRIYAMHTGLSCDTHGRGTRGAGDGRGDTCGIGGGDADTYGLRGNDADGCGGTSGTDTRGTDGGDAGTSGTDTRGTDGGGAGTSGTGARGNDGGDAGTSGHSAAAAETEETHGKSKDVKKWTKKTKK